MEKEFLSQNLCVCVCVSEFWSQNFVFGKELLSYNRNFVFEKRFFVLLYVTGILCLEKEFLSQNLCVCVSEFVCPRICVSQNFVFGQEFCLITGILCLKKNFWSYCM